MYYDVRFSRHLMDNSYMKMHAYVEEHKEMQASSMHEHICNSELKKEYFQLEIETGSELDNISVSFPLFPNRVLKDILTTDDLIS